MLEAATNLLRRTFGHPEFRPLQERVIVPAMAGRDVLAVLPTGGGKSLCFQVPALHGTGLTVVVSPLIALMQDQVARLSSVGVAAEMLGGDMGRSDEAAVLARAGSGELRLLYLSPERLPRIADELNRHSIDVVRLAVDEAHCIVEWGHDFRPSYRRIRHARLHLGRPQCIALTASATPEVRRAIRESLGMSPTAVEVVGSFDRSNLRFEVLRANGQEDRLARMIVLVRTTRGPAIVYAPTRGLTEGLAAALIDCGVAAAPYHAGMAPAERRATLDGFLSDRHRVVVATCAFGMGIDKADVRLVAHWTLPSTPESYYQEAGRAGRDGRPARCVLFHHPSDERHPRRQLATTFPEERIVEAIWRDPSIRQRHPVHVVAAADRLEQELMPARGKVDWSGVRRRRREAERRLAAMLRYSQTRTCRRAALMGWFGESVRRCTGCDNCRDAPR
ncbi:MAG TPA: RecQ family ATP-dependent DNA helicase [Gemmatimonadales bacterium]|nr:RecQ family ATP-dependent DNA helicase [Gemmatimonadales bacterium]